MKKKTANLGLSMNRKELSLISGSSMKSCHDGTPPSNYCDTTTGMWTNPRCTQGGTGIATYSDCTSRCITFCCIDSLPC
ncbi:MAG: hypothetical protein QM528_06685 [Phycisphaerales bacterium]|nr:hypothetical protein [Phycisphaerales bacterium]